MSGIRARLDAIQAINSYRPIVPPMNFRETPPTELFGSNVFNERVMRRHLPESVFATLQETWTNGKPMDSSVADIVASAMKEWAVEKGATHYCHVFYPMTGQTAEKHDSFLTPDGRGGAMAQFSGKSLIQGEPDASSFPSGGLRQTFEARGYTAWDVTSPAYILETPQGATLCIPTIFISWNGEALDKKTPLLRSEQALNHHAQRILGIFGHKNPGRVQSYAGAEQEFFLIDRNFFFARPDLITAGRTIFGAPPSKGQEFADHYFGAIPRRVLSFMMEVEQELYKLGVPVKARHNEVAPGQFEIAPLYETANIANDHQQLTMVTLKRVAKRYGMACLLHEKPFAGINGSGKHLNYSLGNATQGNFFDPGDTPQENAQFLVFCVAMIRAVHLHAGLLRAVVATAANDHRLGGHEAPPAIMSIFLGQELAQVFEDIAQGQTCGTSARRTLTVGVDTLPPLPRDSGDRNRTSPFAFTQNRFEFRAVGSSQSIAGPVTALNTILADSLDYVATRLENQTQGDPSRVHPAAQALIREIYQDHQTIVFNGDGYSQAWKDEAARRGLPNYQTAPEAIPNIQATASVEIFERMRVLSGRELNSRTSIFFEQYSQTVLLEARLAVRMTRTIIFPAAMRYQGELAATCQNLKAIGKDFETRTLDLVTERLRELLLAVEKLEKLLREEKKADERDEAEFCCGQVIPAMREVRAHADALEGLVADNLWFLPSYQEMLFIK
ncbi:MAG: glutamine synthetase type III [Deltaproteobacteria bacterium]|nr:glutamine synthetase type III [Deltaproteobacteria bacterium]